MRGGIGLPAAVPGTDMTTLGQWAADSERAGFAAVGVIDRLVYDNLEPLTALAAAAARTARVAAIWETSLATMRQVWAGKVSGHGGPMSELPEGRAALLFGGLVPAAHKRAATQGQGWVAPLFGLSILQEGTAAVRKAWAEAGRPGQPRIVTGRYFSLGDHANAIADEYIRHDYGDEFFPTARADTLTTAEDLRVQLEALRAAGTTDVVLYPASGGLEQIDLLAEALQEAEISPAPNHGSWHRRSV